MAGKRKVVLYIAQSLDGYIARPDDDFSWLKMVEREHEDYGYAEFVKTIDTVIIGRRTYEIELNLDTGFPHQDRKCYVLSNTREGSDGNVEFYGGDVEDLVKAIRSKEGKDIFVDGGARTVRALRSKDLIDEYVISIIPILIGKGIRLFQETDNESRVRLVDSKVFDSGLVQLKYERADEAFEQEAL